MSLFDYFNNSSTTSSVTSSSLTSSSLSTLLGTSGTSSTSSADDVLNALANGKSTTAASGVTISSSATIAAAAKEDADKDATTLATQIRTTLDAQYAKSGNSNKPDFSEASPRALSTVILNKSGNFTPTEVYAAKQEMKERDRQAFLQVTSSGFNLASIQSYQQQMATAKTSMSAEEKAVRATGF
ncbi:MAG TPA: hypothetical protein VF503_32250 [Sphingobium sp.]|uniref:hypothetical protein n=1 Tax=Sphingobium sp. TaxID=1912891 RepID=UPI002ED18607